MKLFCALLAMLTTVQICQAEPIRSADIAELNDGILAFATHEHTEAIRLLRPLAENGQPLAQLLLGRIYVHSNSVTRDCGSGVSWLIRASDLGNAEAAFELADLYKRGHCVAPNESIALNWYIKAAEEGYPAAPNAVAEIYLGSDKLAPDYPASLRWFLRAVRLFDKSACFHIGTIYAQGRGVPTDYKEAYKWFELSLLLTPYYGDEWDRALTARDRVREQLMPAQVAEADADANRIMLALLMQFTSSANSQTVDTLLSLRHE